MTGQRTRALRAIAAGAALSAALATTTAAHAAVPAAQRCGAEDAPGWDWSRCGNHRRGVVTMWGTPKIVTCGDLRWLVRHGDLDRRSTPRLPGDARCGRKGGR